MIDRELAELAEAAFWLLVLARYTYLELRSLDAWRRRQ